MVKEEARTPPSRTVTERKTELWQNSQFVIKASEDNNLKTYSDTGIERHDVRDCPILLSTSPVDKDPGGPISSKFVDTSMVHDADGTDHRDGWDAMVVPIEVSMRRNECSRRDSNPGNELGRLRS